MGSWWACFWVLFPLIDQIISANKRLQPVLSIIFKYRFIFPSSQLLSDLEYSSHLWSGVYKNSLSTLVIIKSRTIRLIEYSNTSITLSTVESSTLLQFFEFRLKSKTWPLKCHYNICLTVCQNNAAHKINKIKLRIYQWCIFIFP